MDSKKAGLDVAYNKKGYLIRWLLCISGLAMNISALPALKMQ